MLNCNTGKNYMVVSVIITISICHSAQNPKQRNGLKKKKYKQRPDSSRWRMRCTKFDTQLGTEYRKCSNVFPVPHSSNKTINY